MNVIQRQQRPFADRLKIGKYGEDVVIQYFKDNNIHYIDVRDDKVFQKDEIDFITYIDGKFISVEVKTSEKNIYKDNKLMVKTHTKYDNAEEDKKRGNDAYLYRTKADYFFYVCCQTNDIIIVKTKTLRDYINANKCKLSDNIYQDNEKNNSKYNRKNTTIYIPISKLKTKRIKTNYKLNFNDIVFSSKRQ